MIYKDILNEEFHSDKDSIFFAIEDFCKDKT